MVLMNIVHLVMLICLPLSSQLAFHKIIKNLCYFPILRNSKELPNILFLVGLDGHNLQVQFLVGVLYIDSRIFKLLNKETLNHQEIVFLLLGEARITIIMLVHILAKIKKINVILNYILLLIMAARLGSGLIFIKAIKKADGTFMLKFKME